jgi:putative peptidoglycan binding protein
LGILFSGETYLIASRKIRTAGCSAICALLVAFILIPCARARSSADTSTKKATASKASPTHRRTATSTKSSGKSRTASKKSSRRKKGTRVRGQQKIDSERAQAIQEALIREHYLTGQANGSWDAASEEAMRRYQADQGWQSKTVPDSRALIKLGLGPSKDHLLNPESAMTTVPDPPKAQPLPTTSSSAPTVSQPAAPTAEGATSPSSNSSIPQ